MAVGPWQILVVLLLLLLLFGATRLSEIGKGLGEGIRNFRKGLSGDSNEQDAVGEGEQASPKQLPENSETQAQEQSQDKPVD
jgi:sec-independent protein translocase protein TatA